MKSEQGDAVAELTAEDYSKAMNFIGHNLLKTLDISVQNLSPALQSKKVVAQSLSAFIANVCHRQFPKDKEARSQMLSAISQMVQGHLNGMK